MPEIDPDADIDAEILERLVENPLEDSFEDHHEDLYRHVAEDGSLRKVRWAEDGGFDGEAQSLHVENREGEHDMAHSTATGDALVSNGYLGVDLIRVEAGDGFVPHTHPGDHILIPVLGEGTITYDGDVYPSEAGEVYVIEGKVPHAVGAITDTAILAIGAPHAPVDSGERMTPTEYESVTTEIEHLNCLICELEAEEPTKLHDEGCPHCPCYECIGEGVSPRD